MGHFRFHAGVLHRSFQRLEVREPEPGLRGGQMFFHVHAGRIQVILRHSPPGLDVHPQPKDENKDHAGQQNFWA